MKNNPESILANQVIIYFESMGYITYKEVSMNGGGSIRADIYCVKGNETIAIEVKMNIGLKIIEQGWKWRQHANKTYIVLPKKKINSFAEQICVDYGIGLIYIKNSEVIEKINPYVTINPILPKLYDEQLLSEASNNKGEFITPFKLTVNELLSYVGNDRVLLKEAISNIKHHYKNDVSAFNSIKKMIEIGVIKLKLIKEGKNYLVTNVITSLPDFIP